MINYLWTGATTLASPALRLLLRYRAARGKELPMRLNERRGIDITPRPPGQLVWLHAASIGETLSILPVLTSITQQSPRVSILLTTGTVTSAHLLGMRLSGTRIAERVSHRFVPLDVPAWVNRFLDHWRPDAACFVESELWPNILSGCRARSIPTMLINARMSARSYASWARVPWVARVILGEVTRIHARSNEDAGRLRALGARNVEVAGDLKLAAAVLPVDFLVLREFTERLAGRPVFVAASTHPGEEQLICSVHDALRSKHPGLLTIIVPRHPERGPKLAEAMRTQRRTIGKNPPGSGLWIADTLGELGLWYRLGQVIFVGRSLILPGGGQNTLEPARLGRPVVTGPFIDNFREHAAVLQEAGALRVIADERALVQFVDMMLADPIARRRMGERAQNAVKVQAALPGDYARAVMQLLQRE